MHKDIAASIIFTSGELIVHKSMITSIIHCYTLASQSTKRARIEICEAYLLWLLLRLEYAYAQTREDAHSSSLDVI
ncbi:hypothetical protein EBB07_17385 [Paenibacillaceae bacterium]|nr:hypothetical protein EBB07_17385 [Paenibacillaceae bacterium]